MLLITNYLFFSGGGRKCFCTVSWTDELPLKTDYEHLVDKSYAKKRQ
jgi:hypothetical protein